MQTTGKEVIYLVQNFHTGQIREASSELLFTALAIARQKEELLESVAHINPGLAGVGVLTIPLPDRVQKKWTHKESWVERFLLATRVIRGPRHLDQRLDELLPSLDTEDPYSAERFLFGSRERIKYLLSEKGRTRLDTLKYGIYAYIESRVLRKAVNEGTLLTQAIT